MRDDNKREAKWVRCRRCGHKLMKVIDTNTDSKTVEIKCSSCKEITVIEIK